MSAFVFCFDATVSVRLLFPQDSWTKNPGLPALAGNERSESFTVPLLPHSLQTGPLFWRSSRTLFSPSTDVVPCATFAGSSRILLLPDNRWCSFFSLCFFSKTTVGGSIASSLPSITSNNSTQRLRCTRSLTCKLARLVVYNFFISSLKNAKSRSSNGGGLTSSKSNGPTSRTLESIKSITSAHGVNLSKSGLYSATKRSSPSYSTKSGALGLARLRCDKSINRRLIARSLLGWISFAFPTIISPFLSMWYSWNSSQYRLSLSGRTFILALIIPFSSLLPGRSMPRS